MASEDWINLRTKALMRLQALASLAFETGEQALMHFGIDAQRQLAIEECAELIVALKHEDRRKADEDAVRKEIADVLVMTLQMVLVYGVDECADVLGDKIRQLRGRLEVKAHG